MTPGLKNQHASRPSRRVVRAAAALLVVLAGVTLAGQGLHWPSPTGIDDADITLAYANNIARGHGIVYQPGGEHVEGSTSFLWTMLDAVFFLFSRRPEPVILLTCLLLTWLAVDAALGLYESLCQPRAGEYTLFLILAGGFLLAWPAFYAWSVLSLMEIALWVGTLTIFVAALTRRTLGIAEPRGTLVLSLSGAAACLTRQEGVAVILPLLALHLVLARAMGQLTRTLVRDAAIIAAAVIMPVAMLTGFRLAYFGYPLPNTFYAKVSSDTAGRLADGLAYLKDFLSSFYLAASLLAGVAATVPLGLACVIRGQGVARKAAPFLIPAGAVAALLVIYIGLGGDHFALARFYQPVLPLLPAPVIFAVLQLSRIAPAAPLATWLAAALGSATLVAGGYMQFQTKAGVLAGEFYIAHIGRELGRALNEISANSGPFSIGVITAGGVARTYHGQIYDLMGLNWVAMAHADSTKSGLRDHASFNKAVFWSAPPDLVAPRLLSTMPATFQVDGFDAWVLRRIIYDADFRTKYTPAWFRTRRGVVEGYALKTWLKASNVKPAALPAW